ncbi:hypothetical protein SLEP1_g3749 [Rubroshorea leprosula]|uniref:Uncharacterized protein n=1 Tax=Rubroshorea leprosula TaxID=152421 RepID=A0AAV5HXA2_9ROSI|nr:hypothetical protein SLEP1_g3749 [Rubroshorea leprosula]
MKNYGFFYSNSTLNLSLVLVFLDWRYFGKGYRSEPLENSVVYA